MQHETWYSTETMFCMEDNKNQLKMLRLDSWNLQTLPNLKGLINVYMCIQFELDTGVNAHILADSWIS